jgi:hypothetical protein
VADLTSVPTQIDFTMPSGDSRTIRVKCIGADRAPFSLAEANQIRWQIARSVRGPAMVSKDLTGGVEIVQDGDDWYIQVEVLPEDTEGMKGDYYHECEARFTDGAVLTPFAGVVTVVEDLVRDT